MIPDCVRRQDRLYLRLRTYQSTQLLVGSFENCFQLCDPDALRRSFLEGPKAALMASEGFNNGHYDKNPERGVRAFARAYSSWPYSQAVRLS